MQSIYISKLMELAENDKRILHLIADSGTGYDELFRHNFPNQIYNFGIAEENMVAVAAGLATTGQLPYVYTSGAFLVYRAIEFIRDDICFQNLNVKFIGMGSGLAWSSLGPTHHTTEEISFLRAIPGLRVLSPATPYEVGACIQAAYEYEGPVYIRIGMNHEEEFFENDHKVVFGQNEILLTGSDVAIFSTGSILGEVMKAANKLNDLGINTSVINVVSIKPFDTECVKRLAEKVECFVTVEEHNIIGGLGSIIADAMVDAWVIKPLIRIGLPDIFAKGYGTISDVRKRNHLECDDIVKKILETLR